MAVGGVIDQAQRLLSAGRHAEAEGLLRGGLASTPADAAMRLLLARLLAGTGRKPQAIAELEAVVAQAPALRDARLMLARLANELRQPQLAARHARVLVESDARHSEGWSALGMAAFNLGRKREAVDALRRAVALNPAYAAARYNLAAVLVEQERSEEALAEAEAALRHGAAPRGAGLVRARAFVQLDRLDEAERTVLELLAANRHDVDAHGILLRLRQIRGDEDPARELRSAATAPGAPPPVRLALADAERRGGSIPAAERLLRALIGELGPDPRLASSLATVLQEAGRPNEALESARAALRALPDEVGIAENFVATALSAGAPAEALTVVEKFRALRPLDQRWITYRIDIARLLDEAEFASWYDAATVVHTIDLPAPRGFASMASFLGALEPALQALHRQRNHPLDQSPRTGTQTSRNLLVQPGPEIAALLDCLREALAEMQQALGHDAAHPFRARNLSPAHIIGCWSVRLRRGGFHVNHIHPEGWISSACYVSVPAEVADTEARSGWLKFGEPRFPVPGLEPFAWVQPAPGRLVLFPSYLWHGTNAISGDVPRMSVAFDALPEGELA
jgi:uncharacterized protein (TIGR02466 family)